MDSWKALENAHNHANLGLVWLVCAPMAALAVVRSHYQEGCKLESGISLKSPTSSQVLLGHEGPSPDRNISETRGIREGAQVTLGNDLSSALPFLHTRTCTFRGKLLRQLNSCFLS